MEPHDVQLNSLRVPNLSPFLLQARTFNAVRAGREHVRGELAPVTRNKGGINVEYNYGQHRNNWNGNRHHGSAAGEWETPNRGSTAGCEGAARSVYIPQRVASEVEERLAPPTK